MKRRPCLADLAHAIPRPGGGALRPAAVASPRRSAQALSPHTAPDRGQVSRGAGMTGTWRHEWAEAVRSAADLSMTARMVGQVLALDFANADTGQCKTPAAPGSPLISEFQRRRSSGHWPNWWRANGWRARPETARKPDGILHLPSSPGKGGQKFAPRRRLRTRVRSDPRRHPNGGQICTERGSNLHRPIIGMKPNVKEPKGAPGENAKEERTLPQSSSFSPWQEGSRRRPRV